MPDLINLILDTNFQAFKQNKPLISGSVSISGAILPGANIRTWVIPLGSVPDMVDIMFNGPTDLIHGFDPRPSTGWFKQGSIHVPTTNEGGGNPAKWEINGSINGSLLTIQAVYVQTFTAIETMTTTNFSYRLIDYSVF